MNAGNGLRRGGIGRPGGDTSSPDPRGVTAGSVLGAAGLYFAIVFGTGFVLGPIRVLVVTPQVGERAAQLLEAPIMLAAIVLAARWIVCRFSHLTPAAWLGVGLAALTCVLAAEFAVMTLFWRMALPQYLAMRDPVGLGAYVALLVAFASMPLLLAGRRDLSGRA